MFIYILYFLLFLYPTFSYNPNLYLETDNSQICQIETYQNSLTLSKDYSISSGLSYSTQSSKNIEYSPLPSITTNTPSPKPISKPTITNIPIYSIIPMKKNNPKM